MALYNTFQISFTNKYNVLVEHVLQVPKKNNNGGLGEKSEQVVEATHQNFYKIRGTKLNIY